MSDKSTHVHGDAIASAVGPGASVKARDVNVYKSHVDASINIHAKLRDALKLGREAIEQLTDREVKEAVLKNYDDLTDELNKPAPNKSTLGVLWAGIERFTNVLAPIVELGSLLATHYGIQHGS